MFTTGQLVVCINDDFPAAVSTLYRSLPVKDVVYTIRDVLPARGWNGSAEVGVLLEELVNDVGGAGSERAFNAERFAPITPPQINTEVEQESLTA